MRRRGAGGRHTQVCAATLRAPRARLTLERMNARQTMRLLTAGGTLATGAAALTYAAYRKDLRAVGRRLETERQVIDSAHGPIEHAEAGDGPAVLFIHGAGGGFDQGLEVGCGVLGDAYRVIAPSRFGYLGTALPEDASARAQADAYLRLLDALQLDTVPVLAASAGAPSAMQLCLRHPERCSALVLMVPLAWAPDHAAGEARSPLFETVVGAIASSDFVFWAATKAARMALLQTILGTPVQAYRNAPRAERRAVDRLLRSILPISRRVAGMRNDGIVASTLTRYELEDVRVPTLVITAADDRYGTWPGSFYTAQEIANARFVGFQSGGHLLLGHREEVQALVTSFLAEQALGRWRAVAI